MGLNIRHINHRIHNNVIYVKSHLVQNTAKYIWNWGRALRNSRAKKSAAGRSRLREIADQSMISARRLGLEMGTTTKETAEAASVMEATLEPVTGSESAGADRTRVPVKCSANLTSMDSVVKAPAMEDRMAVVAAPVRIESTPTEGVEAPAERAGERSKAHVGKVICPRVLVPSRARIGSRVLGRHLIVGFHHIFRAKAIPVIEFAFRVFLIEFLWAAPVPQTRIFEAIHWSFLTERER